MDGNSFTSVNTTRELIKKIAKFLLVGGTTFVVYFSLQTLLQYYGFADLTSVKIAYVLALFFHFSFNYKFTFQTRADGKLFSIIAKYGVVNVINYLINIFVVSTILNMLLSLHFSIGIGVGAETYSLNFVLQPLRLGMVLGIATTMITGFLIYNIWVFRRHTP